MSPCPGGAILAPRMLAPAISCALVLSLAAPSGAALHTDDGLGEGVAALGGELQLSFEDLDEVLIWRHGRSPDGRSALQQLVNVRVLQQLALEAELVIDQAALQKRIAEFDRELREMGSEGGLAQYLSDQGVDPDEFRELFEVAMVHEELTRRALGRPAGETVSGDEQSVWLEQVLEERGFEELPHPWIEGVVARSGSLEIRRDDFARHLRTMIPREEITDACYELLLEHAVRDRMPDLAEKAFAEVLEAEIELRRTEAEADPTYQGVAFEQLLDAQGLSLEALRRDPALRVAALSRIWVGRNYDDEALKRAYEDDRELFDSAYGEALELFGILLRAARFKNDLNPRTFEEAEQELADFTGQIKGIEDLMRLAALHSEDPRSRGEGGRMGWVTRGATGAPRALRDAVFDELEAARALGTADDAIGRIVGPVRVQGGVLLLGIAARRPAPAWETMAEYVEREMRRRFLEGTLPRTSTVTWLDPE